MKSLETQQLIIDAIQEKHASGQRINSGAVQKESKQLYSAALRNFKSWREAVECAGFDYQQISIREYRLWDESKIVKEILRRNRQGKQINYLAVVKEDYGLYLAARRNFGKDGWRKALRAAGFQPSELNPRKTWTKARIKSEILSIWNSGQPVYAWALIESGKALLVSEGVYVFGTWKKALIAAGLDYKSVLQTRQNSSWGKAGVTRAIKKLHSKKIDLSSKFTKLHFSKLHDAGRRHFGYWGYAVEAAGLNYVRVCKNWSSKAWLRRLTSEDMLKLKDEVSKILKGS